MIACQGEPVPDDDAPLFQQLSDERLFDPLPDEPEPPTAPPETETVHDDHDVTPVSPDWFLPFDEVDSRLIRTLGAPE
jgi:hypothetical protein